MFLLPVAHDSDSRLQQYSSRYCSHAPPASHGHAPESHAKRYAGECSPLRACEYNEVRCVRGSADHGATRRAITTPPVHRLPSTKTQIWISERQLWLYPLTEHLGVTGMTGLRTRRVPGVKSAVAVFVWYCMPPDLAAEAAARHERHEREATSGQRRPDAKRVRRSIQAEQRHR